MSPRKARPDNILPGDHDLMSPAQLRSHYSKGCTHDACRAAVNEYQKAFLARRRAKQHESASKAVVEASQDEAAADPLEAVGAPDAPTTVESEQHDRVPALGCSRRLQGLVFAGHAPVDIARATQISVDAIWWLLFEQHSTVSTTTHRIIDREYRRLRTLLPEPSGKTPADKLAATGRSKSIARDQGWASPFAWTDIDLDETPTFRTEAGAATRSRAEAVAAVHTVDAQPAEPRVVETTEAFTPEPAAAPAPATLWAEDLRAAAEHLQNAATALAEAIKRVDA